MTEMFISAFYARHRSVGRRAALREHRPSARVPARRGQGLRAPRRRAIRRSAWTSASRRPVARAWNAGRDLLVLFTDGVSDARNRAGERLGEERVLEIDSRASRRRAAARSSSAWSTLLDAHTAGRAAPRRSHDRPRSQLTAASRDATARGLPPIRKSLGQHFLNDRRILERIADALELTGDETVVEIGPGRGS